MPKISPLAVVDSRATLADDVEIGPFCAIGPEVKIGPGCRLLSHVVLMNRVTLGKNNLIYPHAVLGGAPQDKKFKEASTRLEIGDGNVIREAVTIHIGTYSGGGVTRIGCDNLLMVNSHFAHDVQVGNNCVIVNNTMVAGHVVIGNNVFICGAAAVNRSVTVHDFVFVAAMARVHHDVPPFLKIDKKDNIRGLNSVGLKRGGFSDGDVAILAEACRRLFARDVPMSVVLAEFDSENGMHPLVKRMVDVVRGRDKGRQGRSLEGFSVSKPR